MKLKLARAQDWAQSMMRHGEGNGKGCLRTAAAPALRESMRVLMPHTEDVQIFHAILPQLFCHFRSLPCKLAAHQLDEDALKVVGHVALAQDDDGLPHDSSCCPETSSAKTRTTKPLTQMIDITTLKPETLALNFCHGADDRNDRKKHLALSFSSQSFKGSR